MAWYGDPDDLDVVARRLQADAGDLRLRAGALDASVATMRWQGQAATAFRGTVHRDTDALRRAARELDEAAAALHAHAAEVRARLHRIRMLEQAVTDWFGDRLDSLRGLPAAGERAWLEVADELRARGVPL